MFPNNLGFPTRARKFLYIMPRFATYPSTYDDCLTIEIKNILAWGYLRVGYSNSGVISWSRNGVKHSSISISSYNTFDSKYLTLDYKSNGIPITYRVEVISVPSNLGKGEVFYFLCPKTGKRCRKLYLQYGYFYHREAYRGTMYECQLRSKKTRGIFKIFDKIYIHDTVYCERYKKYFKTHYNGKPTKRFLKLENKIRVSESYPPDTLERLMLM